MKLVDMLKVYIENIKKIFKFEKVKLVKEKDKYKEPVVIAYLDALIKRTEQDEVGGQIFWVNMRTQDINRDNIEGNHTKRPFLVVKDLGTEYFGYYFTGNLDNVSYKHTNYKRYRTVLPDNAYDLNKASVVQVDKPTCLPKRNVIRYVDSISKQDLTRILIAARLIRGERVVTKAKNTDIGNYISRDHNKYLIYQKDNSNIYAFKTKYIGREEDVDIDFSEDTDHILDYKEVYEVSYDEPISIPTDEEVVIVDKADKGVVGKVLDNRKQKKYEGKNRKHRRKR